MDGTLLSQCLEKLRASWLDEGKSLDAIDVNRIKAGIIEFKKADYIFPRSFSLKLKIPVALGQDFLVLLLSHGLIDHYSVPKHGDEIYLDESRKGFFESKSFEIQDPSDFEIINANDLEIISAFKVR